MANAKELLASLRDLTLLRYHTYGRRYARNGKRFGVLKESGKARNTVAVPIGREGYPRDFEHQVATQTLRVGAGESNGGPQAARCGPSCSVRTSGCVHRMEPPAREHAGVRRYFVKNSQPTRRAEPVFPPAALALAYVTRPHGARAALPDEKTALGRDRSDSVNRPYTKPVGNSRR